MLAWVVVHLEHPDELSRKLRALGARAKDYNVEIDHYAPVGSASIWMFQQSLGDRFTPEMEEAWLEAYAFISFKAERGSRKRLELVPIRDPQLPNWAPTTLSSKNMI